METVTRNISDMSLADRLVLEHVIGHSLRESQKIVIQVVEDIAADNQDPPSNEESLPSWCNVYAGLTEEEIASVEKTFLQRANLTRTAE